MKLTACFISMFHSVPHLQDGGQGRGEKLILSFLCEWHMTLYCSLLTVLSSLQTHEGDISVCISELKVKRLHTAGGRASFLTKIYVPRSLFCALSHTGQ